MQLKADSELVRRQNRRIVLDALRRSGPMARVDLGRATGLSPASITAISSQLIAERVIEELETPFPLPANGRRGRPSTQIGLNPAVSHMLAVNIAIDAVIIAVANYAGTLVMRERIAFETYRVDPAQFGNNLVAKIRQTLSKHGLDASIISRIGVAVQGVADNRTGSIVWSPAFKSRDIPLAAALTEAFSLPVTVANDANMMAESLLTPEQQALTTATIFTGSGVGMGLIINDKVFHGATGAAAEFGHMNHIPHGALCRCGRRGCIEAYAADYGILRMANGLDEDAALQRGVPATAIADVLARAHAREPAAVAAFDKAGEALGFGIGRLIALLNLDRVVLAGPGMEAQKLLEPALRKGFEDSLVEELRRHTEISFIPVETDLILRGTVAALLRQQDESLSALVIMADGKHMEAAE
jgi:predicted NBD/HSP70 family sugar kinase